jgi:hypothetical protein
MTITRLNDVMLIKLKYPIIDWIKYRCTFDFLKIILVFVLIIIFILKESKGMHQIVQFISIFFLGQIMHTFMFGNVHIMYLIK